MSLPQDSVQRSLAEAAGALRRGRPAQAAAACEALLVSSPDHAKAWGLLAAARQALGDAAGAHAALERAYTLQPQDAALALELGTLRLQAGDAGGARRLLTQAMRALPREPRAAFRCGTAAFLVGDYAAAIEGFAAATRCDPNWAEAWNNLAAAHGRRQEYPTAIAAARQALRLRPQSADTHQALAALLSNLFDRDALQEGLRFALRALQLDPALAEAHRNAAVLLRKLGEPLQAETHARRAAELAPRNAEILDALGEQLLVNGRPGEAVKIYGDAAARGVVTPALRRQHGIALLHDGQPVAAGRQLAQALEADPGDQRAIAHLGLAIAAGGQIEAAERWLGLRRHVHALALPPPPGFADAAAFNAALAQDIRRHSQQRWEPAGLAARNAYLSGDLLADRTAAIVGFERRLREAIDAFLDRCRALPAQMRDADVFLRNLPDGYRLHVWATQAAQSGYIDTHIHEDSWLSGAYYVELPEAIGDDDPTHAGWIEFGRPYAHLPVWPEGALRRVCPQAGMLLLFPSYLFHRTLPYTGPGERISISFDLAAV